MTPVGLNVSRPTHPGTEHTVNSLAIAITIFGTVPRIPLVGKQFVPDVDDGYVGRGEKAVYVTADACTIGTARRDLSR